MAVQITSRVDIDADPVVLGARLGFYDVLSRGPVTAAELAQRTNTSVAFVREWLAGQARQGYVTHDVATDRYANFCSLPRAA